MLNLPRPLVLRADLALCGLALLVEAGVGYPAPLFEKVGHLVTWMGRLLSSLDRRLNLEIDPPRRRKRNGALALVLLLLATGIAGAALAIGLGSSLPNLLALVLTALLASTCLAQRSLHEHVTAVADALEQKGVRVARTAVGAIVGRDTSGLDEAGVSRAAIESLAENFADGVVAPAFWIALLGLPGGFLYKAINTADSMIGHRTPRHEAFGFAAARLDDLVNLVPARLSGLLLIGASTLVEGTSTRSAWRVMIRDARGHPSPNAGWPEAAMAGAIGVRLGGPRTYAGRDVHDAFIGDDTVPADAAAIRHALRVYRMACGLQIVAVFALWLVTGLWR